MNAFLRIAVVAALLGAPAKAGWKAVPAAAPVPVATGALRVSAPTGWNRWSKKPIKKGERWSFDGPLLNRIDFFVGLQSGDTFAREANKKREPLPKFAPTMKATDVAEMYEATLRAFGEASDFTLDAIEPAPFSGAKGFRFAFRYSADELARRGEARGAIVGGRLYLIVLDAPELHYFDAARPGFTAIADSARVASAAARGS